MYPWIYKLAKMCPYLYATFWKHLEQKNDFKISQNSKLKYTQYRDALWSQIIRGIQPCITIFSYWFFWHRKVEKYLLVVSLTKKKGKKQQVFLLTKKTSHLEKIDITNQTIRDYSKFYGRYNLLIRFVQIVIFDILYMIVVFLENQLVLLLTKLLWN